MFLTSLLLAGAAGSISLPPVDVWTIVSSTLTQKQSDWIGVREASS